MAPQGNSRRPRNLEPMFQALEMSEDEGWIVVDRVETMSKSQNSSVAENGDSMNPPGPDSGSSCQNATSTIPDHAPGGPIIQNVDKSPAGDLCRPYWMPAPKVWTDAEKEALFGVARPLVPIVAPGSDADSNGGTFNHRQRTPQIVRKAVSRFPPRVSSMSAPGNTQDDSNGGNSTHRQGTLQTVYKKETKWNFPSVKKDDKHSSPNPPNSPSTSTASSDSDGNADVPSSQLNPLHERSSLETPLIAGPRAVNKSERRISSHNLQTSPRIRDLGDSTSLFSPQNIIARRAVNVTSKTGKPIFLQTVLARRKLAAGGRKLDAARLELAAGGRNLAAARCELAAGGRKIAAGRRELAAARRKLAAGRRELAAGGRKLSAARRELAAGGRKLAAARRGLAAAR